jgi:hypothetical protein
MPSSFLVNQNEFYRFSYESHFSSCKSGFIFCFRCTILAHIKLSVKLECYSIQSSVSGIFIVYKDCIDEVKLSL